MKKIKLTAGIVIMLMITSTFVFSQNNPTGKNQNVKTAKTTSVNVGQNSVDKNHDGTCTKAQNPQCKQAQGKNFVDKNGDGNCDNCGSKKANCKDDNCKAKQTNCKPDGCGGGAKQGCGKGTGCPHK